MDLLGLGELVFMGLDFLLLLSVLLLQSGFRLNDLTPTPQQLLVHFLIDICHLIKEHLLLLQLLSQDPLRKIRFLQIVEQLAIHVILPRVNMYHRSHLLLSPLGVHLYQLGLSDHSRERLVKHFDRSRLNRLSLDLATDPDLAQPGELRSQLKLFVLQLQISNLVLKMKIIPKGLVQMLAE